MRSHLVAVAAVAGVVAVLRLASPVANQTTVALGLLLVVLFAARNLGGAAAVTSSVASMLGFNFFFIAPTGTFTVADPLNWIALAAFLVVGLTVGELSSRAQRRSDQMKSALLDAVTHDLRTPLTSIKASTTAGGAARVRLVAGTDPPLVKADARAIEQVVFQLLQNAVRHVGKVLTHRAVLAAVWGPEHSEQTEYLRVFVGQLRKKIEDNPSETPAHRAVGGLPVRADQLIF